MNNKISLLACFIISIVFIGYRIDNEMYTEERPLMMTDYDGFGYYMYLPSGLIYDDFTELEWVPEMNEKYKLTGDNFYQAHRFENGNYVNKYLGGVSIMQLPLFAIGHVVAINSDYPADGFSPPYQYALAYGVVFYCLLALFLLRNILLRYFNDSSVAVGLILLFLASNLIQYVCVQGGLSHAYIFPLYVLVLYATIKWHEKPTVFRASAIGIIIGLATICRPTEAIMLFIPLLWNTHTKEAKKEKWALVKKYRMHILFAVGFGFVGVLPQLIYWKLTSGDFVYNVGSSWRFLTPFFRVLFGGENGWFIYTPVTILFVAGFFFMKKYPFRRSVLIFCLLNIWIVISWADWKYGATYSTRALTQSYPIFALALTSGVEKMLSTKWKYALFLVGGYLIFANAIQLNQYNRGIIHYRDMNGKYYAQIYLDLKPDPLDYSLLDTDEILEDETGFKKKVLLESNERMQVQNEIFGQLNTLASSCEWVKVESTIRANSGFDVSFLRCRISNGEQRKSRKVRLSRPMSKPGESTYYIFYVQNPFSSGPIDIDLSIQSNEGTQFWGDVEKLKVSVLK